MPESCPKYPLHVTSDDGGRDVEPKRVHEDEGVDAVDEIPLLLDIRAGRKAPCARDFITSQPRIKPASVEVTNDYTVPKRHYGIAVNMGD